MVFRRLLSSFRRIPTVLPELPFSAVIDPDEPFYVVGDIHGCLDALVEKLDLIEQHQNENPVMSEAIVVLIGDYVDRGPKSAQVLDLLYERCLSNPDKCICIFGNHEQMMLDFIDDPAGKGRRWLRFGGLDTLASYGLGGVTEKSDLEDLVEMSMDLETALGPEKQIWLREMPKIWRSGNVVCVHAGLDPNKSIEAQKPSTMVWGHPDFEKQTRDDENWVVHGHTIVPHPMSHSGRIATDTGAYKTDSLTVAAVQKRKVSFF